MFRPLSDPTPERLAELRRNDEVAPHDSGCWYCHTADENLVFSIEWDAYVHLACIREALERDPQDAEALVFARELGIETAGVGGDERV